MGRFNGQEEWFLRNCDKELVAVFHLSDNKPFRFLPPLPTIIYILPKCIHSSQSHQNSPPITESGLKSKLTPSKSDSQIPFCVYLSQYEDLQTKGTSDLSHLLTYQTYNVDTQSSGAAVNTDFKKEWGNGKHITVSSLLQFWNTIEEMLPVLWSEPTSKPSDGFHWF